MTYYIQDPIIGRYVHFNTITELVTYLEGLVQRAHHLTRKQYMQNLIELGYGYDDAPGVTFTRSLGEGFNIGVIKDGKYVKTDVHAINSFSKPEFGH
jgi:hypothetical protein